MRSGEPSRTALAAARHRAAHQLLEHGGIFTDPLAVRILGEDADTIAREAEENRSRRMMRIFIAVRTRFAEDALAAAVEAGVSQLVVLGAGLDTYAWRGAMREHIRIFEVDHPATQAWKRRRLAEAALPFPPCLTFAPVDFEAGLEQDTLSAGLQAAGFDPAGRTFFTWLGVVPYLTEDAVWSTLGFIASLPSGAHVVFDYSNPPHALTPEMRALHDIRAARVAELGEAWTSYFDSDKLRSQLIAAGFTTVEDLGPREIAARYFPHRVASAPETGGHVVRAATTGSRR
ncbi:MAG TPA: SAM-dependent methyltransferase [Bryobacteraceae bacterium]|jgi:methyltransferase (TIGR00027 family)|nr:SAM-dependent methyltransferase [Bryobacteraceae bacterium]